MKRLITYGDSCTEYKWSTWADILAKATESNLLNRAVRGAGNNFIQYRIKNDLADGVITQDDSIKIMWSMWSRVVNIIGKNKFTHQKIDDSIDGSIKTYKDNFQIIQDTEQLLIQHDLDYEFLFWSPMNTNLDRNILKKMQPINWEQELTKSFPPSIFEIVYNSDWTSRQDFAIQTDAIPKTIFKHLQKLSIKQNISIVDLIRSQDWLGNGKSLVFFDLHPTPEHHLDFLQAIYPDLEWSDDLIAEINLENQEVLSTLW